MAPDQSGDEKSAKHTIRVSRDDTGNFTAALGQIQNTSKNLGRARDRVVQRAIDDGVIREGEDYDVERD